MDTTLYLYNRDNLNALDLSVLHLNNADNLDNLENSNYKCKVDYAKTIPFSYEFILDLNTPLNQNTTYFDDIIYCVFSNTRNGILKYYNVDFSKTTLNGTSVSLTFVCDYWRTFGYNRNYLTINQNYGHISSGDSLDANSYQVEHCDYENCFNENKAINILSSRTYNRDLFTYQPKCEVLIDTNDFRDVHFYVYVVYTTPSNFIGVGVFIHDDQLFYASSVVNEMMKIVRIYYGGYEYSVKPYKCYVLPAHFLAYGSNENISYGLGSPDFKYKFDGDENWRLQLYTTLRSGVRLINHTITQNGYNNIFINSNEISTYNNRYIANYLTFGNLKQLYKIRYDLNKQTRIHFNTRLTHTGITIIVTNEYLNEPIDIAPIFEYLTYYNEGSHFQVENANSIRLEKIANNLGVGSAVVGGVGSLITSFLNPVAGIGNIASSSLNIAQAVINKNKFLGSLDDKKLQKIKVVSGDNNLINAYNFVLGNTYDYINNDTHFDNYGFMCKNYIREIKPQNDGNFYFTRGEIINDKNIPQIIKQTFNTGVKIVY